MTTEAPPTPEENRDRRRRLIDTWRRIYENRLEDLSVERLSQICRDKGVILWEDEAADVDNLKNACREANIVLVEDLVGVIDPTDSVLQLATEVAFNPRFTECADAIRRLREELKCRGVYSRAVLDNMI